MGTAADATPADEFLPLPSSYRSTAAAAGRSKGVQMSRVRLLVGTRKGAFVLTSDGKRQRGSVSGPHFGGWQIYHVAGSPAEPARLCASQSCCGVGQLSQRFVGG